MKILVVEPEQFSELLVRYKASLFTEEGSDSLTYKSEDMEYHLYFHSEYAVIKNTPENRMQPGATKEPVNFTLGEIPPPTPMS